MDFDELAGAFFWGMKVDFVDDDGWCGKRGCADCEEESTPGDWEKYEDGVLQSGSHGGD